MIEQPSPLPRAAQAWHTRPMGLAFYLYTDALLADLEAMVQLLEHAVPHAVGFRLAVDL
jgi:hypothetical protein